MMLVHLLTGAQPQASTPVTLAALVPIEKLGELLIETLAFTLLGLILFAVAFWIIKMVLPFSMRKEIEEDHNMALGIIIASIIIGIAMIVSAAVHG
jgi:uncharacterized membrane protein YjfL (UPF0719 family)